MHSSVFLKSVEKHLLYLFPILSYFLKDFSYNEISLEQILLQLDSKMVNKVLKRIFLDNFVMFLIFWHDESSHYHRLNNIFVVDLKFLDMFSIDLQENTQMLTHLLIRKLIKNHIIFHWILLLLLRYF